MGIYTHKGDDGTTGLLCIGRVPKYEVRVEVLGTVDELNSWIDYIRSINIDEAIEEKLARLQPRLDVLCSDVAAPIEKTRRDKRIPRVQPGWDKDLEMEIDEMQKSLSVLTGPIRTVGSGIGAALQLARTVCRRAERWLVLIRDQQGGVNQEAIRFTNRLSDYLFTLARWANHRRMEEAVADNLRSITKGPASKAANTAFDSKVLDPNLNPRGV
jgi:cob(I)alamin adenosyltransferase